MNRVIRLKEWGCNLRTVKRPSEKQLLLATSDLKDKDYVLNTDDNGFIISSLLEDRHLREKTIIIMGDSFIESIFVDENKRINAVIEDIKPDIQVLNGGYSGATTLHLANTIINKVIPINPDYVVFFMPTNDQRIQGLANGYWNKDFRLSPVVPLGKDGFLIDNYSESSHLKSVDKLLSLVHSMLEIYDIPHCYATTPHRQNISIDDEWIKKNNTNIDYYSRKIVSRKSINKICKEACIKLSVNCVDLEEMLQDKSDYFYDDLHLTNSSSPLVAKILWDSIKYYV